MANKEASLLLKIKTAGQEALDKVVFTFGDLVNLGKELFSAISFPIKQFQEQEAATNSLNRALVNGGIYTRELSKDYLDQAEALSKVTMFGDEQIIQAQSAYTQFAKNIPLTKEATSAILDFAQAQGIDAAQAAEVIGKSIGTSTNALARYGIEVAKGATEQEKFQQVMTGLNSKFGGQAQAATDGLGALQLLQKSVFELFEVLGARLAPVITLVANELNALVSNSGSFTGFIDGIGTAFEFVIKSAMGVQFAFQSLGTIIGGTLGTIAQSLSYLVNGEFSKAKDSLTSGFTDLGTELETITNSYQAKLQAIDEASLAAKAQKYVQEEQMLKDSLLRQNEIKAVNNEEQRVKEMEDSIAKQEEDIALIGAKEAQKNEVFKKAAEAKLQEATTDKQKLAAMDDIYRLNEEKKEIKLREFKQNQQKLMLQGYAQFTDGLASLSSSSNSQLASIGKAAAISSATINAYLAIQNALANVPFPANIAAAAGIGVSAFANVSKIAGVQLAEGGIVMPRPGGTQATIGEAGQAEAVIPLDRAAEFGLGGGGGSMIINVYGGLLGSESDARQFAVAVDKELLKLRRNNESVSFDSGVI